MHQLFAGLSLAFSVGAYIPLILSYIWNPRNKPQKSTWVVFALVDVLIFFAMLAQGEFAIQVFVYVFGASSIMGIAVFWKGEPGWTREDKLVLGGAALAMVLWRLSSANTAIVMSLIAISIGTIPLWKALWKNPKSQPRLPWFLFWAGGLCGLFAIKDWSFASALGPCGFFLQQTIIVLLCIPRRQKQPA